MTKRFTDRAVLDALWAWSGDVTGAASSIQMNRGQFYDRLDRLGIKRDRLDALRNSGILKLSDESVYLPSPGVVRYVQPKEVVLMKSGGATPNLLGSVSTVTQRAPAPVTVQKRAWVPKPSRGTQLVFERAVLELSEVGKDTNPDQLLEALAHSEHFQDFVSAVVRLYKAKADVEEGK